MAEKMRSETFQMSFDYPPKYGPPSNSLHEAMRTEPHARRERQLWQSARALPRHHRSAVPGIRLSNGPAQKPTMRAAARGSPKLQFKYGNPWSFTKLLLIQLTF